MSHILADFKDFLEKSPTSWHAAEQIGNRLASLDFIPLSVDEKWQLEKGKKYFVVQGGSLCAFALPAATPSKIVLLGSHTDSPALKLKPNPEIYKENMTLYGVEIYGGPLLSSWLNRDLAIAGRVVVTDQNNKIEQRLVFMDDVLVTIPQLAIHLDREVNEKGLIVNKQDHLAPLIALSDPAAKHKGELEALLRTHLRFNTLLSFDLFLVPIEPPRFLGPQGEMIAAYRLDNLSSAHACATAIASAKSANALQIAAFWDHEEIGSRTSEGAFSPFLADTMQRIQEHLKMNNEDWIRLKSRSLCLSVDMSHAFNPNFANKHDPNHQSLLGKGVVIKYNADHKYASNAATAAEVIQLCRQLHLPYQSYVSRSDLPSGSTVGPIVAHHLGLPTVDIGAPQLSMHSTRETMACQDHIDLCHLLTHALQAQGAG